MKNFFILTAILITAWGNLQAKPVAGVTSISWNTNRAMTIAALTEEHTLRILKETGSFDTIDPGIINRELSKFSCFDEKCIITFAGNADISLVITGNIQDRDSYLLLTLKSYGVNRVLKGRLLHSFTVRIPLDVPAGSREFSLIAEEHAADFISRTLRSFRHDIPLVRKGDLITAQSELRPEGTFPFYTEGENGRISRKGSITLIKGDADISSGDIPSEGSFIILDYKDESVKVKNHYRDRKREILFHDKSAKDTLYIALLTPFASASMPLASPFLGYYMNNDWAGLGLWMVNATPYIYMEAHGLYNSPSRIRGRSEDISRDDIALHWFGWYMAAAGGMPLFIDSYAHNYLLRASYFSGDTKLLGNNLTAAYLSLVSNGGGMFYKGHRGWGYFYFHLNNMLLYTTMRDFARPEEYQESTDSYRKKPANSGRGKILCGVLGASKIVETIHTLTSREKIDNGTVIEEYSMPEIIFSLDENNSPFYGAAITFRF